MIYQVEQFDYNRENRSMYAEMSDIRMGCHFPTKFDVYSERTDTTITFIADQEDFARNEGYDGMMMKYTTRR